MAAGAGAIALSSATTGEHSRWQEAAQREADRYGIDPEYVRARMFGEQHGEARGGRTWIDWTLVGISCVVLIWFGIAARVPHLALTWGWMGALVIAMTVLLIACGAALWRLTRFT
jgi:hypothetical protein